MRVPFVEDQLSVEEDPQQDNPLEKNNGNQGGDPPAEIPRIYTYNIQNESRVTQRDLELGDKGKH